MDRTHAVVGIVALIALLMAFVIGCALVSVPTAQQTPIITTVLGFITLLGSQVWSKADTDRKLSRIEAKADTAAERADVVASNLAAGSVVALPADGKPRGG